MLELWICSLNKSCWNLLFAGLVSNLVRTFGLKDGHTHTHPLRSYPAPSHTTLIETMWEVPDWVVGLLSQSAGDVLLTWWRSSVVALPLWPDLHIHQDWAPINYTWCRKMEGQRTVQNVQPTCWYHKEVPDRDKTKQGCVIVAYLRISSYPQQDFNDVQWHTM